MNTRTLRHVLARSFVFCTCGPGVGVPMLFLLREPPPTVLLLDLSYSFSLLGFLVTAGALSWLGGAIVLWPIVSWIVSRFNGGPFDVGDVVYILIGPHRDRTVRVYDVWPSRGQIRVELGETERAEVKDVFEYVEVCRA
jgi:hypothetical protein